MANIDDTGQSSDGTCEVCQQNQGQHYNFFFGYSQSERVGTDSNGNPDYETFYYDMQESGAIVCENCVVMRWERRKQLSNYYLIGTGITELLFLIFYFVSQGVGAIILSVIGGLILLGTIIHYFNVRNENFGEMGSHTAIWVKEPDLRMDGWNSFFVPQDFQSKIRYGRMFMLGDEPMYQGNRYGYSERVYVDSGRRGYGGRGSRGGYSGTRSGTRRRRR